MKPMFSAKRQGKSLKLCLWWGVLFISMIGMSMTGYAVPPTATIYFENGTSYFFSGIWINQQNLNDSDYNTRGYRDGAGSEMHINYTKLANFSNVIWQAKWGLNGDTYNETFNISVPSDCINAFANVLAFKIDSTGGTFNSIYYCKNGSLASDWITLINKGVGSGYIFEEGVYFNYTYSLDNCSNSFNIASNATMLNYTAFYENNLSKANISVSTGSYLTYNLVGLSETSTLYPTNVNRNSFEFCGYPNFSQFEVSYNIIYNEYGSTTVRQRGSTGLTISSSMTTIPLYILSGSNAIYITLIVTDSYSNPLGGVNVQVVRNIAGVDYTVQTAVTGDDGVVSLLVDSTQSYTITASKQGYTSSTKTINYPTYVSTYSMILGAQTTSSTPFSAGIAYSFSPTTQLSPNTNYSFMFNLSSSHWNITSCNLTIKSGLTTLGSVTGTFNSSLCGNMISVNTTSYSNITSYGVYVLNGTIFTETYPYLITTYSQGNYSLQTVIDDLNNLTGSGFNWQTKMFLAFIIIVGLTMFVSIRFNAIINPEQSLILQCALVFAFSLIGWLTIPNGIMGFSFPTIGTGGGTSTGQYALFILDLLATGGYIAWRHS